VDRRGWIGSLADGLDERFGLVLFRTGEVRGVLCALGVDRLDRPLIPFPPVDVYRAPVVPVVVVLADAARVPGDAERRDRAVLEPDRERRVFVEPPLQRLFTFARSERLRSRAEAMGGYDVSRLGTVKYNAWVTHTHARGAAPIGCSDDERWIATCCRSPPRSVPERLPYRRIAPRETLIRGHVDVTSS
jgi:hypothetical protein